MTAKVVSLGTESVHVSLSLRGKVTVVSGDSGTGKTFLADTIESLQMQHSGRPVFVVRNRDAFELIKHSNQDVVLIDNAEQYLADSPNAIRDCIFDNPDKYFIVFLRGHLNVPFAVRDMADVIISRDNDGIHVSIEYHMRWEHDI